MKTDRFKGEIYFIGVTLFIHLAGSLINVEDKSTLQIISLVTVLIFVVYYLANWGKQVYKFFKREK
jgi:uncharacterized MAPEG superfamily protein